MQSAKLERHGGDRFGDHPGGTAFRSSSDERHFDNYRAGFSGDGQYNHHHQHDFHYSNHHDYQSNQFDHRHHLNTEPNDSFDAGGAGFRPGGGNGCGSMPLPGRKRGFNHSGPGPSPDHIERGSYAKLYVASVPRTATEEDIRPLFEDYGNIVEVVLMKDKRTGQQQGSCFVKYATVEEADRAIRALNNHYTFPGLVDLLKVRYADGEKERLGTLVDKVYVGCLNKQASKMEIEEIFSPFGVVEDVYIMRDEMKQSRGCGFVKFSHRDMAVAAMSALNGTYIMRGCDQPLIVRFADPKKPRNGESRGNSAFGGPSFGPRTQEPVTRLTPNLDDHMGGRMLPNASYPVPRSNYGPPAQQISTVSLPEAVSEVPNQQLPASNVMQQLHHPLQQSPSKLSHMPSQHTQTPLESSQSSQQTVSQMQKQLDLIQPSTQNLEQQQSSQVSSQQSPRTESNPQVVATTSTASTAAASSTISAAPMVPVSTQTAAPLDCDWSEHTCPDGCKYYYNCATLESKWEKPEEYTLFEQLIRKQLQLQNPSSQQLQSLPSQQEIGHVHVQSATSPAIACVQQGL